MAGVNRRYGVVGIAVVLPFLAGAASGGSPAADREAFRFDDPDIVESSGLVAQDGLVVTTNDSANDPTNVTQVADLTVTKSHAGNFRQGDTGNVYTLTVKNAGPGPTVGAVTLTDTLPAGLTATAMAGTGWTCTLATLQCTRSDALAAGGSYEPVTVTVDVALNAPASVTNSATVAWPPGPSRAIAARRVKPMP